MDSLDRSKPKLRMITYLHPGLPLGLFQTFQYYLEETLGQDSHLVVESRWSCPPTDRTNPFTADEVDVAFMCSSGYLKMIADKNPHIELCHAAPVFQHEGNSDRRPIYFTDVVVRKEKETDFKEFLDLKGHRWAVNDEQSLSGSIATLVELKRIGFDSNFFGDIKYSGSHHSSIDMVLGNIVDGAAVDSNILRQCFIDKPELKKKIHVLCSWGPLPIYPVVLNTRLPADVREKICQGLLNIHTCPKYQPSLEKYKIWGFHPIDESLYEKEKELKAVAEKLKTRSAYY